MRQWRHSRQLDDVTTRTKLLARFTEHGLEIWFSGVGGVGLGRDVLHWPCDLPCQTWIIIFLGLVCRWKNYGNDRGERSRERRWRRPWAGLEVAWKLRGICWNLFEYAWDLRDCIGQLFSRFNLWLLPTHEFKHSRATPWRHSLCRTFWKKTMIFSPPLVRTW